jgi:hypothetical protein
MIIWGWGKVTKKVIGRLMVRQCSHCNSVTAWELCLVRTWFTLFFIPIIPYSKKYCVVCSNCGSYIALNKEQYLKYKEALQSGNFGSEEPDSIKYNGKTETQINYLKQMEEANRGTNS